MIIRVLSVELNCVKMDDTNVQILRTSSSGLLTRAQTSDARNLERSSVTTGTETELLSFAFPFKLGKSWPLLRRKLTSRFVVICR